VLFWSGIWYGMLIFLKIIFKESFIYLKCHLEIYIYSETLLARPPTGRHWTGRVGRVEVVAPHLHSWRFHVLSRSLHFYNSFLDWKLFSFVLRAAIAYPYFTIKSHNGKNRCRRYKFKNSLQYEFVTTHWHLLRLHVRLHPCLCRQLVHKVLGI